MILSRQLFSLRWQCCLSFTAVFPRRLRLDVDVAGLTNREKFGYVERVSWFSEFSFGSFPVGSYVPAAHESWASSLFNPYGDLSIVGEKFFELCAGR